MIPLKSSEKRLWSVWRHSLEAEQPRENKRRVGKSAVVCEFPLILFVGVFWRAIADGIRLVIWRRALLGDVFFTFLFFVLPVYPRR